jgi:hypothetical protein
LNHFGYKNYVEGAEAVGMGGEGHICWKKAIDYVNVHPFPVSMVGEDAKVLVIGEDVV